MTVINAVAGSGQTVLFTVTPPATGTPTVTIYSDAARSVTAATVVPTGAGASWTYVVPTGLVAGTYYTTITSATAGGSAVDANDTLVIAAPSESLIVAASPDYFSLAELRALPNVGDTAAYPDALAISARSWITAVIERVCLTSFVYRTFTEVLDGSRAGQDGGLSLSRTWVRQVTALDVLGQPSFDPTALAGLSVSIDGTVLRYHTQSVGGGEYYADYGYAGTSMYSPWPRGFQNLTVTYVAGFSQVPPDDLKQVALQAARYRLVSVDGASGVPSRALSIVNEFGNVNLASASLQRPTGIPDVDAVILGWAARTVIPGVA